MSLESLSTEFSLELSRYLDSAVESELQDISFESCSTIKPNARDTNQISMRMDQINQELEDIKNSFHSSTIKSAKTTKILSNTLPNHLDRFDSIPVNIKAYIRQEIQCLNDKLPNMISQIVKREIELKLKNPTVSKSPVKDTRPPWDNDFTLDKIPKPETFTFKRKH